MQLEERTEVKAFSILTNRYIQLSILYLLLFSIPFIFKSPQLLIGSVINFLLIVGITQFRVKEILPALFLPSISTYIYGTLFGGATTFLIYLVPLIGLANMLFVLSYRYLKIGHLNIVVAAILKTVFLFTITYILFKASVLPQIFLTTMGISQLFTATIGGVSAHLFVKSLKRI